MLTKTELVQKKAKSSEQLELSETGSKVDDSAKKRRFLFISLFATIGLSFIFWSYRQIKVLIHQPLPQFNFSLPTFNLPSTTNDFDSQISQFLINDPNKWNVAIYFPADKKSLNWSQNNTSFDYEAVLKNLNLIKKSSGFTATSLPEGLEIKDNYLESNGKITLDSLVTTPQKTFLVLVTIEGQNPINSKQLLSQLLSTLYWQAIKN